MSTYVIINEFQALDSKYSSSEIVGGVYFGSEDDAWEALSLIAEAHSVSIDKEDTSFEPVDIVGNLEYDTYYIQELYRG